MKTILSLPSELVAEAHHTGLAIPARDKLDLSSAVINDPLHGLDLDRLNNALQGIDVDKLNDPLHGLDLDKLSDPLSGLDLDKLNDPLSGLDFHKLNDPLSGLDLDKLNDPLPGLDLDKLNDPLSGLDLDKLNDPLHEVNLDELADPLGGLDPSIIGEMDYETKVATELAYANLSARFNARSGGSTSRIAAPHLYQLAIKIAHVARSLVPSSDTVRKIVYHFIISLIVALLIENMGPSPALREIKKDTEKLKRMVGENGDHIVRVESAGLRKRPNPEAKAVDTLSSNNTVELVDKSGDWTKIKFEDHIEGKIKTGWILSRQIDEIE